MAIIFQTSTNNISLFKVVLISTGVLSAAIMLTATGFVDHIPSIYNGVVSWLRPPYLYLVINCIIISIVASSRLHSAKDDVSASTDPPPFSGTMAIAPPPPVKRIETVDYPSIAEHKYDGVVLDDSSGYEVKVEKGLEFDSFEEAGATKSENLPFNATAAHGGGAFAEDAMSNKENEYVMTKPTWSAVDNNDLTEYSPSIVKPSVSARFSHRRNVRASPEGGRTVLGVSKPKRQDTLEGRWKTIIEGRPNRHLKKSDTWEREGHGHQPEKTMKKAETFNYPSNGGGEGEKVRKEASLSQDELNRRVEAFIKKFNEDMRLQRQESLNQYKEMINAGSN